MESILQFFATWWPIAVIVAAFGVKLLNRITPHFDDREGVTRVLLILVDALDVIKLSKKEILGCVLALFLVAGCVTDPATGKMKFDTCTAAKTTEGGHMVAKGASLILCANLKNPEERAACMKHRSTAATAMEALINLGGALLKSCGL